MSKNETSLSAVYLTIPLIRVHGSVYCKIFFQSPANECRRQSHINIEIEIRFFKARNPFHLKNTRKCFPIRRLTLCTLSVNQKVTHLFVLLICLFY